MESSVYHLWSGCFPLAAVTWAADLLCAPCHCPALPSWGKFGGRFQTSGKGCQACKWAIIGVLGHHSCLMRLFPCCCRWTPSLLSPTICLLCQECACCCLQMSVHRPLDVNAQLNLPTLQVKTIINALGCIHNIVQLMFGYFVFRMNQSLSECVDGFELTGMSWLEKMRPHMGQQCCSACWSFLHQVFQSDLLFSSLISWKPSWESNRFLVPPWCVCVPFISLLYSWEHFSALWIKVLINTSCVFQWVVEVKEFWEGEGRYCSLWGSSWYNSMLSLPSSCSCTSQSQKR